MRFKLDEVDQATISSKFIQSPIMTCCLIYVIFYTIRSLLTADQAKKRCNISGEVRDMYICTYTFVVSMISYKNLVEMHNVAGKKLVPFPEDENVLGCTKIVMNIL